MPDPASRQRLGPNEPTMAPAGSPAPRDILTMQLDGAVGTDGPEPVGTSGAIDPDDVEPGTMIHHFEVIRELGRGGMGRVLMVRDTKLARLAALKLLRLDGDDLTARLVVEARATARCHHENIVVIYEVGDWQGLPYMALEFLEGESLGNLARRSEGIPVGRVVDIMTKVVSALVRAHELNIVHCDLKPDNVFLGRDGAVKVLDFGIALIASGTDTARAAIRAELARGLPALASTEGTVSGTPPYMSFEQWGIGEIDHRSDIWAVGIMFWDLLVQLHPLGRVDPSTVLAHVADIDRPLPSLASVAPDLPKALVDIVDRCLVKRKEGRFPTASALLDALRALAPERHGVARTADACPFPGMSAFQEGDADRFFGRDTDIATAVTRLGEAPVLTLAGPSGIGKSSLVRAGLVPALKARGPTDVLIMRPGSAPLDNLVAAVDSYLRRDSAWLRIPGEIVERQTTEPGALGALLRSHARTKSTSIVLFIDQFEELFTIADAEARAAFIAAFLGIADDVSSPLRVVLAVRSDFLDRAAEHPHLMHEIGRGLLFLRPLDRSGMADALTQPLAQVGYAFESPALVDEMLDGMSGVSGALPLLQFTAANLWAQRDRQARKLTRAAYDELGGVAGALAHHAEAIESGLTRPQHRLLRMIALRLVTAEGTRAQVARSELEQLGPVEDVRQLVERLVQARLLTSDVDDDDPRIELVHESLVTHWRSLRRWRDDSLQDTTFLHELRPAARQWDSKGRPRGLLWQRDALGEARAFLDRGADLLAPREREFLDAAIFEAERSARRSRMLVTGGFAVMALLVASALLAIVIIRGARNEATAQASRARQEAERAQAAELAATDRLQRAERAERERLAAEEDRKAADAAKLDAERAAEKSHQAKETAETLVEQSREDLAAKNQELRAALRDALAAKVRADEAAGRAEAAQLALRKRLDEERAELARVKQEAGKLAAGGSLK